MKNARRKKKRPPKKADEKKEAPAVAVVESEGEDEKKKRIVLKDLVGAFNLSSVEEAAMALGDAGGDPEKASEILRKGLMEDRSAAFSSSSSSSLFFSGGGGSSSGVSSSDFGSTSGSSEGFVDGSSCGEDLGFKEGNRQKKKLVAATGTVSNLIGKEYVTRNNKTSKCFQNNGVVDVEKAEQFLCSMLGDDSDLDLAVVRDVFCQCRYNVDKALDVLLDLNASSNKQSGNDRHPDYRLGNIDDMRFHVDNNDTLIDRRSECTSFLLESDSDNFWSLGPRSTNRNYAEVLSSSKASSPISPGSTKSDLPQKVLESLFHISKSSEHDKGTMNWKNVVKKMQSLGPGFDVSHVPESQKPTYAKEDAYHMFREGAKQHWDSVKSYYQKATTAYTKGDRAYAAYLSDQGKEHTKLAQKADTKASHDIFMDRNKAIENVITIDLHGQHVKSAMKMLKLHLLFGSYVPSVQTLRVITGCGSHGLGKSKLKESAIKLLDREEIQWVEENRGTLLIKLDGWREFSFLDSDSDSGDSN